jgi:FKBP-type peptidyl-prolyl isomerase-like protein
MAEPRRVPIGLILLSVVVIVGAGVGTAFLYEYNHPNPGSPAWTAQLGDNVTVNYLGMFGSGAQQGRVFDTSLYSAATNNLTYPKSLEFSFRGSASQYTPLAVHVGPSGSYAIGNLTFGTVVTGFWQGLIGLPVGKTQSITVPPNLGYGQVYTSCLATHPLSFPVAVLNPVAVAVFSTTYPGVNATAGTQFTDPTYGWTDLVLSTNATSVVVENLPSVGWSVPKSSWPVTVTNVNATTITLTNQLSATDAGLVLGTSASTTVCGSHKFIVSAVNPPAGTFTELYDNTAPQVNAEIQGQTLVFVVTVVAYY